MRSNNSIFAVFVCFCISLMIIFVHVKPIHPRNASNDTSDEKIRHKDPRELFYREIIGVYKTKPDRSNIDMAINVLARKVFGVELGLIPPTECTFVIYKPSRDNAVEIESLLISHHGDSLLPRPLEQAISSTYYSYWRGSYPNRQFYKVEYFYDVLDNTPMYVKAVNNKQNTMVIIEVHLSKKSRKIDPVHLKKINEFKSKNPDYSSGYGYHFRKDIITTRKFPNNGQPGEYGTLVPEYHGVGHAYDFMK